MVALTLPLPRLPPTVEKLVARKHWLTYQRVLQQLPVFAGIELTWKCPVGCKGCYFFENFAQEVAARGIQLENTDFSTQLGRSELYDNAAQGLTPDQWQQFVMDLAEEGWAGAIYVGGETLNNSDALRLCTGKLGGWIVTSAVSPLFPYPGTENGSVKFGISLDGGTGKTHNELRGVKKLFELALLNVAAAQRDFGAIAYVHFVANKRNYLELEQLLRITKASGFSGVLVSTQVGFYNPGFAGADQQMSNHELLQFYNTLLKLKEEYGPFLVGNERMFRQLHPDVMRVKSPERCSVATFTQTFKPDGTLKEKCVFGPGSDCSTCGCMVEGIFDVLWDISRRRLNIMCIGELSLLMWELARQQPVLPPVLNREFKPAKI